MTSTSASAHESTRVSLDAERGEPIASMDCPLEGDSQFSDSWGDRRSGGRRHEGVDMIAERGIPVVAALAGFAEFKNTSAGGKSVWLTTSSGDKFFYAHLDEWEGESREVAQGELVGYVGSTGNAGGVASARALVGLEALPLLFGPDERNDFVHLVVIQSGHRRHVPEIPVVLPSALGDG
jgi:murein DD-endopeptidase MepM/ murein hydrolase activator NlpD